MRRRPSSIYRRLTPLVLISAAAALAACAGGDWMKGTGAMDLGPVIPIQPGGPHRGETETGTAALDYVYQSEFIGGVPAKLRLSGQLRDAVKRHAGVGIYVVYLNAAEGLLDKELVLSTGAGGYGRKRDFDEALDLPAGTTAFRFASYSGPERGHR